MYITVHHCTVLVLYIRSGRKGAASSAMLANRRDRLEQCGVCQPARQPGLQMTRRHHTVL